MSLWLFLLAAPLLLITKRYIALALLLAFIVFYRILTSLMSSSSSSTNVRDVSIHDAVSSARNMFQNNPQRQEVAEHEVRIPVKASHVVDAYVASPITPSEYSSTALVFTHPWAILGGDLNNNVPYVLARTLSQLGFYTCRFNFRGMGISRGHSEMEDCAACVRYLRSLTSGPLPAPTRVIMVGYSYGSISACAYGGESGDVDGFVGIGIPLPYVGALTLFNGRAMMKRMEEARKPKLLVMGDDDAFASEATFRSAAANFVEPRNVVLVRGGDHFWFDREAALAGFVLEWVRSTFIPSNALLSAATNLDGPHLSETPEH